MAVIETRNLTKKFKELVAVDGVNLEIKDRECFGLLGPNGAGKTSLIRMITGVSPPNSGEVWVSGFNLRKQLRQAKAILGVVPQGDNLDPDLNVIQNLTTFARYFDISKSEARRRSLEILRLFEMEAKMNSRIKELSGGMRRRLLIARGLINMPLIVVFDEPTIGLDPQSRHLVWHKLNKLKSEGITLLLCTQNMDEAAILCDRVAVMHHGIFLDTGKPHQLIQKYIGKEVWEIDLDSIDRNSLSAELEKRRLEYEFAGNTAYVFHVDTEESLGNIDNIRPRWRSATLEDVFFRLAGRSLIE
ncbi:ABC transporter ATP-binding protein [Chloroflexota bacterium]